MDAAQRKRMLIGDRSLGDIVAGPGRSEGLTTPAGVPLAELDRGASASSSCALVETYARNMRTEMADDELRRMREAGLERLHFAWAGPIDPGHAHYYRVHGPTAPDRVRQHAERRQPHPLGVARPAQRLRRRSAARALPAGHRHA